MLLNIFATGMLPWDVRVNYRHTAFVMGSDGTIYRSVVSNGPGTGNPQDPTADDGSTWAVY